MDYVATRDAYDVSVTSASIYTSHSECKCVHL